jgi:predicted small lipoprotein YifL
MKRFLFPFGVLALLIQLTGCGSSPAPTPADYSNLPDEVKEQMKREEDRAKGIRAKIPTPPPQSKGQGVHAVDPGAR